MVPFSSATVIGESGRESVRALTSGTAELLSPARPSRPPTDANMSLNTSLSSALRHTPPSSPSPTDSTDASAPAMPIVTRIAALTLDFIVIGGGQCCVSIMASLISA